MVKPYSRGYLKRCWSRTKFKDVLVLFILIMSVVLGLLLHYLGKTFFGLVMGTGLLFNAVLVLPYCINHIPKVFNENHLYKATIAEDTKRMVDRTPLNERAFHNEQGIYVFGSINANGFLMELGKTYTLWVKSELVKLYLANYDVVTNNVTGIVFNDNNTGGRRLVTVSLEDLKKQFTSPTGSECMYEAEIGIRGMSTVAQDHYFK